MNYQIYWFFIFVFVKLIPCSFENYIHLDLKGRLKDDPGFNFTMFIQSFKGVVFYGIDSFSTKCLIELEQEHGRNVIIMNYNKINIKINSQKACRCEDCRYLNISFILALHKDEIIIICNEQTTTNIFKKGRQWPDLFTGYPIPKSFYLNSTKNQVFIWMGNIGSYNGYKDVVYLPLKNQLVACIKNLYFNNKIVSIQNNTKFIGSCTNGNYFKGLFMTDCKTQLKISNKTVSSFNKLESNRTKIDNEQLIHKVKEIYQKDFQISIQWVDELINKYNCTCLMQIIFNENVKISIKLDSLKNIILSIIEQEKIICERNLTILSNQTNYFSISFFYPHIRVQISNGNTLVYYNDTLPYKLLFVQFGICSDTNYCDNMTENIKKEMSLQYVISVKNSETAPNGTKGLDWNEIKSLLPMLFIVFLIVIAFIFFMVKEKLNFKSKFITKPRIQYETRNSFHDKPNMTISLPINVQEEPYETIQ